MSEFRNQALKKLQSEFKTGKFDRYGNVMKTDVLRQLEDFIEQDDEFAQAVAQGGTFEDCMKAVARSCGEHLSDVEAYRRAVAFYFPGATVKVQMTIDLIGAAAAKEAKEKAEAAAKRKIADLEKRLNKAEDEAAKAKNEAQSAGESVSEKIAEARKEADSLRAELAEAKKQLKASDADVAKFGVWFTTVQKDFDAMLNALEVVRQRNPETGEKLKAGAATLLKNLLERVTPDV